MTGCTKPNSERLKTLQLSYAPVLAFAGQQGRHETLQVSGQATSFAFTIYGLHRWHIVKLPSFFRLSPTIPLWIVRTRVPSGTWITARSKAPLDLRHCT
ncbi:hypothetical protein MnTg02_02643 [bacterium MnTg02]|nr:hypothetical protein MnTg02_02643 [bacterium MnTg02]